MGIDGIIRQSCINMYNSNSKKVEIKTNEIKKSDRIEISSIGKSLNEYSLNLGIDNAKKVADIKSSVESGTYNVDAKLTAQSLLNVMKEDKS